MSPVWLLKDSREPSVTMCSSTADDIEVPQNVDSKTYWSFLFFSFFQARNSHNIWETGDAGRPSCRIAIHFGCFTLEETRKNKEEVKRRPLKAQQLQPSLSPALHCEQCPKLFHSQIGLLSHIVFKQPLAPDEPNWDTSDTDDDDNYFTKKIPVRRRSHVLAQEVWIQERHYKQANSGFSHMHSEMPSDRLLNCDQQATFLMYCRYSPCYFRSTLISFVFQW